MWHITSLLISAALAVTTLVAPAQGAGEPGRFDYYALSLSWSPTHCETDRRARDQPQCDGRRPYAFVLHGLWPQYERGWPSDCETGERPWVPENLVRSMLDIMPARGLVIHEYREHGTCSGLSPQDFFAAARRAFESITIPDRYVRPAEPISVSPQQLESDFLAANPQLSEDMMSVVCGRHSRLRELRICLSNDLQPRACGPNENQHRLCRAETITLPPVRGR